MDDIVNSRLPVKLLLCSKYSDELRQFVNLIRECVFIRAGRLFCHMSFTTF